MKKLCPICETVGDTKPYTVGFTCQCGNKYIHCHGWISEHKTLSKRWLKKLVLENLKNKKVVSL